MNGSAVSDDKTPSSVTAVVDFDSGVGRGEGRRGSRIN